MRFLIIAIALFVSTTAQAKELNGVVGLLPYKQQVVCTKTDVVIGVGAGVVAGVAIGVGTVATAPMVGPGVAAGSTVGWVGAMSAPFLTNATAWTVGAATAIVGPIVGTMSYYASCVSRNIW